MIEAFVAFGKAVGFPVLRSVAGWFPKAIEDDTITGFEWKELAKTVIRVGTISAALYFSLNGVGIDVDVLATGGAAFVVDWLVGKLEKKKK